ncbi:hypothetical protein [Candidatus Arthromitus sp. SFB-turkey]|uniref:hypothetical protein n=1 Tax=Candidatus Arthromitus sp. SFB-turkey TaxID=1840217 RepID=UPI0007F37ACF|nr:hypothetical protein [Candidatus Arthromitus sp. SFB-turkey]OAT87500.1 hypothetical protein A6P36_01375 [Candidatus Arthromitus sp. SFB-turkey]
MGFNPGNGVGLGKVLLGGTLGLATVIGLSVGLGIEGSKKAVYDEKIEILKDELRTSRLIADDINIDPPGGKGFINSR